MTDATNTPEGFARISLFDRLEAIEKHHAPSDLSMRAIQLKRALIASAFADKETASAEAFIKKFLAA